MNRALRNKQNSVFQALSNAGLILVQPGFPVEQRTILGLHGDSTDSAISIKWHDAEGCEWEADFTEGSLMNATMARNQISLNDSEGGNICVELYELTPAKF